MPSKAPTLCAHAGCGQLTDSTYCQRHTRPKKKRIPKSYTGKRPNAYQRGYTKQWYKLAKEFRQLHPVCQYCGKAASQVVDHRIPHRGNQELFWNSDNWVASCIRCHNRKTATIDQYQ